MALAKPGAPAPTSASAAEQLQEQAGGGLAAQEHDRLLQQLAAAAGVGPQCSAAAGAWLAAESWAGLPHQQTQRAQTPLPFGSSGGGDSTRPGSPVAQFSPVVHLAFSQRVGPTAHPPPAVRQASQLRPGTAVPCSLPSNVPPLIAARLTARGHGPVAASPPRPATAPSRRQQPAQTPAKVAAGSTSAASQQKQQQLLSRRSLAGQQRGAGAGGQPLVVRGAVAVEGNAEAAVQRGPAWGR